MKKILSVVTFVLFLFSGISYAQNQSSAENQEKKPTFWFGPKVGVDLLTPTLNQGAIEDQVKSNYQVGFFLQFGRKFYIQPEFYYATQKVTGSELGTPEVTVNTLKVPLMLGMRLINLKVISAHIMGGPSASFLLKESVTNPNSKKSNFALQAGGGVDLLGFITLDVRYSVDMSNSVSAQIKQLSWDSGVNVTLGIKLR
ncbi:MAG: porin family protein [Bacteroidia bacterium]|nr:porin family protein [Bacteroidia bacterium]